MWQIISAKNMAAERPARLPTEKALEADGSESLEVSPAPLSIIGYRHCGKRGTPNFPRQLPNSWITAMKANNTPGGMSLGHATADANNRAYWCLWTHGGNMVDENDKVIINSAETEKALVFAKQLYTQMAPGVLAWNDASNNKALLGKEVQWTNNTISIYVAAKRDSTLRDIAEDMDHAHWPVGPNGRATELHIETVLFGMAYTKYPQARKALLAFIMEADQYNKWLLASQGFVSHTLNAYDNNPVWTEDPKNSPFRDAAKRSLTVGGLGSVGEKAASALADFVLVDMFANYCTGRADAKSAIKIAERQLQRIYR
jgi:multiple sugar transport system substrate-binding protein